MRQNVVVKYQQYVKRKIILGIALLILLVIFFIIALCIGTTKLPLFEIFKAILFKSNNVTNVIIWQIRLPRILGAIIAGLGLAASGCVMQNNLRNPLASPSTLGISNAAAFGATFAIIILGAGNIRSTSVDAVIINNPYLVTISSFIFTMIATIIILMLAKLRSFSQEAIVLTGVALGSLFSALTTLIQYFAHDVQIAATVFWTFGDLGRASLWEVLIMTIVIIFSLFYFMYRRWEYNCIENGEELAKSLGVNVEKIRFGGMFVASLITAVIVAFLGIIGFVGLVAPQIIRKIIGNDQRFLLPISALMGALLLLISDTIARTIISPIILPVGVITSFFGAPLFLYLLIRGYKR